MAEKFSMHKSNRIKALNSPIEPFTAMAEGAVRSDFILIFFSVDAMCRGGLNVMQMRQHHDASFFMANWNVKAEKYRVSSYLLFQLPSNRSLTNW